MMERRLEMLLFVVTISFEYATAAIIVKPSNTEVTAGSSTFLNCSTSLAKYVSWYHYPTGPQVSGTNYVYYYGQLFGNYKDRFQLYKNESSGSYDIFIPKVELMDAGVYACQDDEGNGETVSAELIVLDGSPTCSSTMKPDGVVGVNSCNVQPEKLELSCGVSYRGKSPPSLQWRRIEGNTSITQEVTTETLENRITSRLNMTSEPSIDGSSYVCETSNAHYHCISNTIRIIYAISGKAVRQAKIDDTVVCKANASQECRYKWKWFKGEDTLTSSNNQTLIPKQSGDFRCEAECFIRKQPCMLTAMFVYVEGDDTSSATGELTTSSLSPGYVALIVILVILIIATIVVVVYIIYRRCRKTRLSPPSLLISNGDIPIQETELLLQTFEKTSDVNDFSKLVTLLPYLDKGSSGEVYGPYQFKGKTCAFQRILYSTSKLSVEKDKVQREIDEKGNRWLELEHPNIINVYSLHFEAPALYIFMEYAEGGTVRKALDLCKEDLPSDVITNWALQIASGMEYLHDKDIVHTHLKSAQILIMEPFDPSDVSKKKTLKIASYRISTGGIQSVPSFKGMFAWESPESIQKPTFSKSRDIWSYGVTVWEILTRNIPYMGTKHAAIIQNVMAGNKGLTNTIPATCPTFLLNIMMNCWTIEPNNRSPFSEIVSTLKDPKQNLISISSGNAIPETIVRLPYMDKGSSGEVFGPFLFQRHKCACERFMYSPTKVSSVSEDDICRQGKLWMELVHINILRFYDVLFVNPTLYVVMDYAEGESVRKALNSCKEDLEISVAKDWATQIADGMNYLHSKEIVHGRLKSAKVLITFKEGDSSNKALKIGPFGLATDSHSVPVSFKGMFAWMAPESIKGSENTCKASDVWSYGVTVWEILTRAIPYQGMKQALIINNIFEGSPTLHIPKRCPDAIRDILKECWSQDINKRPTFSDILSRLRASADS